MLVTLKNFYARMPSDLSIMRDFLGEALDFIENECRIKNEMDLFEIRVIINELVLNGILHGNRNDKRKEIRLYLSLKDDNNIYITVEDEGPGYDYNYIMERETRMMDETGRGILIVKNLSEKLVFNRTGNRITAVRRI